VLLKDCSSGGKGRGGGGGEGGGVRESIKESLMCGWGIGGKRREKSLIDVKGGRETGWRGGRANWSVTQRM